MQMSQAHKKIRIYSNLSTHKVKKKLTHKHRTDFFMPSTSSATTTFSEAAAASKRHVVMHNEETEVSCCKAMKKTFKRKQASMKMNSQEAARNAWLSKWLLRRRHVTKQCESSQRQRKKDTLRRSCKQKKQERDEAICKCSRSRKGCCEACKDQLARPSLPRKKLNVFWPKKLVAVPL